MTTFVAVYPHSVVELTDDNGFIVWLEKNGNRKFAMFFSPAALTMYFNAMREHTSIAHGRLMDFYRSHTGMHLERVTLPRSEDIRFVAICHFRTADGLQVAEEFMCSDAVSMGLYAQVPFLIEETVLNHVVLMSRDAVHAWEDHMANAGNDATALSNKLSELPDKDLPKA